jgi:hypothetical protein
MQVLKFMFEFVQNKNKRIEFDVASANGILLFRATSNILSEYGMPLRCTATRTRTQPSKPRVYMWSCHGLLQ